MSTVSRVRIFETNDNNEKERETRPEIRSMETIYAGSSKGKENGEADMRREEREGGEGRRKEK